jgi:hypothetical protein
MRLEVPYPKAVALLTTALVTSSQDSGWSETLPKFGSRLLRSSPHPFQKAERDVPHLWDEVRAGP